MKPKSTLLILLAVGAIFAGVLLAGGGQLYRTLSAPRIDPAAQAPAVTVALPMEPSDAGQRPATRMPRAEAPTPSDVAALRDAFAVLLHRTRVLTADDDTLLAYDRSASIAAARELLASDFAWPLLETDFVFVYTELGPENAIVCESPDRCRVTRAVLGIQAVLIFDSEMCADLGPAPCLALLRDDQLDARDNLVTADFRREPDGNWRLVAWDAAPLPAPPAGW